MSDASKGDKKPGPVTRTGASTASNSAITGSTEKAAAMPR